MEVKETSRSISINSFIPVAVITGLGIIYAVVLLAYNCKYKNMRLVKMSSPNINVLMLLGAIFLYLTCALYGLEAIQDDDVTILATFACRAWTWVVSLAYTLLFGSLFAKSWRVHRIFRSAGVKRTVIKDERLVAMVFGLMMIDVIILGLWQGVDPLTSVRVLVYEHNQISVPTPSTIQTTPHQSSSSAPTTTGSDVMEVITRTACTCHYPSVWFALLLLWKGLLLFYGTYLSWVIRHVTLPSMNDSTCIIISCHVTTIVSAAAISLAIIFKEYPDVVYVCVSVAIWMSTTITISVEFLPKVRLWRKKSIEQDSLKVSISSQVYSSPGQTYEQMEEEMYHLVAENRALKKSLTMKDVTIQNLQDHVTSAKEKLTHLLDGNATIVKEDSGVSGSIDLPTPIPRDLPDNDSGHAGDESNESIEPHTFSRGVTCRESHMIKESTPHSPRNSVRGYKIKRRASLRSLTSYASDVQKFAELTDAIADDLDHANCISANLRTSICLDLSAASFETRSSTYKYVRSKQDISGSIAETYDLDDNCDTYSYVSSHLPRRRPRSVASSTGISRSLGKHSRCSSCESISTLGNDKMYPSDAPAPGTTPRTHRQTSSRRQRRTRRVSRRRSWKRRPIEKVYSIQEPRAPYVNEVGVAFRRDLSDTMV